ncbi:unnamed protein product, partial [Didymodactylos carnosus]
LCIINDQFYYNILLLIHQARNIITNFLYEQTNVDRYNPQHLTLSSTITTNSESLPEFSSRMSNEQWIECNRWNEIMASTTAIPTSTTFV